MKVVISGSNGYIASKLIAELETKNIEIVRLKREFLVDVDQLISLISGSDVVINLAGAPIFTRWTAKNRNEILVSRVHSTKNIVEAINTLAPQYRPKLLISASAIGIYEPNHIQTEENNTLAKDFVATVVKSWEQPTENLSANVRKVIFRIGLVLGKNAKTIQNLLPLFRLGLGGKLGSGKQPFPFIHIDDVTEAILWSISNPKANGVYNLVAPQSINNTQFTKAFAKAVNRPAFFTVPAFALKAILGETSSLLLQNAQVYPERLINQGFTFNYPDIESCLSQIIKK